MRVPFWIVLSAFLSGCSSSLVFDTTSSNIPKPLIAPISSQVALVLPEATRNHVYTENSQDRNNWTIKTGPSQVKFLNTVFASMFSQVTTLDNVNEDTGNYDLTIIPTLKDIQFALPNETRFKAYEVWLLYELSVYNSDGSKLTSLQVSGYGESQSEFFKQKQRGLSDASERAFRDLGARLITQFTANPDIKRWMQSISAEESGG